MDIDLHRVPCDLIDMRFVTAYGRNQDIGKKKLRSDGSIETFIPSETVDEVMNSIKAKDGCKLVGTFFPHFIQPSVKIVFSLPRPDLFIILATELPEFTVNLSHTINHLSFGRAGSCESQMSQLDLDTKSCQKLKNFTMVEHKSSKKDNLYYRHAYNMDVIEVDLDCTVHVVRDRYTNISAILAVLLPIHCEPLLEAHGGKRHQPGLQHSKLHCGLQAQQRQYHAANAGNLV